MRTLLRALFALPLLVACSAAAAAPAEAPFLWEVQGPKARHYLLGSVHMLPESAHPLPAALDAAYAATQAAVFESDLAELGAPELQSRMLGAAKEDRPGGLKAQVGKTLYARLQNHAQKLGMPTPVCQEFRAWFCALTLELFTVQQAGFDATWGIDQYFYAKARDDGRALGSLEAADEQLALFTGMTDAQAARFLGATLDGITDSSLSPAQLLRIWRESDLPALAKAMRDLHARYPDIYARLLADRNRAWLSQLGERLSGATPHFIVAGAAHFAGPDGLLVLLRAQGFSIAPVTGMPAVAGGVAPAARDPRPPHTPWLRPVLHVRDVSAAFAFYQAAFGFEPSLTLKNGEGRLQHAELKYRDVVILLAAESSARVAPATSKAVPPSHLQLFVDDVEGFTARAKAAGAEVLGGTGDPAAAERTVLLKDPDGYLWQFTTSGPSTP